MADQLEADRDLATSHGQNGRRWTSAVPNPASGRDLVELVRKLQVLCDECTAASIALRDGTTTSGVLLGVSPSGLILKRWDSTHHWPAGDPITVTLASIAKVVVL